MFRRIPESLPKDPTAPKDLEALGYFITEDDQIRQVRDPAQKYLYKIDRSERVNEVYKEAINACVKEAVLQRLYSLGLEQLRLPIGASKTDRHVPILISKDIHLKRKVFILFPDRANELGIFSYRIISEEGINIGSAVNFTKSVLGDNNAVTKLDAPGLIIANAAQLLWYRGEGRAVSDREWQGIPRISAVHEAMGVDEDKNRIPSNKDHFKHVQYIFENVVDELCHKDAKFSIIGLEYTGTAVMHYVADHWQEWIHRIEGVALIHPQHSLQELLVDNETAEKKITEFVANNTRTYFISDQPRDTAVEGKERHGCECFSSGEEFYEESAFVRCWKNILAWFDTIPGGSGNVRPVVEVNTVNESPDLL